MMHPYLTREYPLAPNVRLLPVPLWGTEHPGEFDPTSSFQAYLERAWRSRRSAPGAAFLDPFERFLIAALGGGLSATHDERERAVSALVGIHEYFAGHDYRRTTFAPETWALFDARVRALHRQDAPGAPEPPAADVAEALRLLYRLLTVLTVRVPPSDLTHSAAAAFCGLPCVLARLTRGTPYLLTEHGIYAREQYLNLRRTIKSPFVRWFMYRLIGAVTAVNYHVADCVAPVCAYNARWETWAGVPSERIRVIHNGADPDRFAPDEAAKPAAPTIANVGLIYPLKGQLGLIEAVGLVRRSIPDVRLRLYGSVNDEAYAAQCRQTVDALGLQQVVTFEGPTAEPWRAYQASTVVAMPSISEAFPYALVEAMLCEAAILATDTGGVSEALGDTGIIVRPRDVRGMADGLLRLLRDPARCATLGRNARQRALAHFTQAQFLREYRATYGSLRGGAADRSGSRSQPPLPQTPLPLAG
jgi:glycosyltransferase involved in cell wall biosynthesis